MNIEPEEGIIYTDTDPVAAGDTVEYLIIAPDTQEVDPADRLYGLGLAVKASWTAPIE